MERRRAAVIIFVCVLLCEHQRVFATEVDVRVKPGENITLYCDRVVPLVTHIVWMRNCSHENQPSLFIDPPAIFMLMFPRFSLAPNSSSNSVDLHIENVSVSDEGIYYCAKGEKKINKDDHGIKSGIEYEYGSKTTRLSVLVPVSPCAEQFNTTSTFPFSDCQLCFILLSAVCPVCVLLFSVCVYLLCQRKITGSGAENRHNEDSNEVCYASLDMPSTQRKLKKKRAQSSEFCTYSEVRTKRT